MKIFDVRIDNISYEAAIKKIEGYLKENELHTIYTPNPEIVMHARDDAKLKSIIDRGDLVTADGIGLIYAAKLKKKPLQGRVTGYDMSIEMLEIANREGYSIYLLGGKDGVSKKAAKNIEEKYKNVKVVGEHNGFFKGSHTGDKDHKDEMAILDEINNSNPDIIFVGLGFPRQELWIDGNKDRIKGRVIIGNGGVIDILAGKANRAPEIWQKLGLEWLYRLLKNPSRIKRQMILPKFMIEVLIKKDVVE